MWCIVTHERRLIEGLCTVSYHIISLIINDAHHVIVINTSAIIPSYSDCLSSSSLSLARLRCPSYSRQFTDKERRYLIHLLVLLLILISLPPPPRYILDRSMMDGKRSTCVEVLVHRWTWWSEICRERDELAVEEVDIVCCYCYALLLLCKKIMRVRCIDSLYVTARDTDM